MKLQNPTGWALITLSVSIMCPVMIAIPYLLIASGNAWVLLAILGAVVAMMT